MTGPSVGTAWRAGMGGTTEVKRLMRRTTLLNESRTIRVMRVVVGGGRKEISADERRHPAPCR